MDHNEIMIRRINETNNMITNLEEIIERLKEEIVEIPEPIRCTKPPPITNKYGLKYRETTDRARCNTLSPRPKFEETNETELLREISEKGIEYTQTFLPQLHMRYRPEQLTEILKELLVNYTKRYKFKVVLIGEYSQTGQYHLHGSILAPPKMINSLRRILPREIGRAELKPISFVESYIKYCFKDEYTGGYKQIDPTEYIEIQ